jgi:predicted kinase
MAAELDDHNLLRLIDFYKCYRAVVRGKVEALKSQDREILEKERHEAKQMVRHYFHLAMRYAVIGSRPIALIVMGRIGTGKSTLSHQLATQLGLYRFNSDRIRKELAGIPVTQPSPKSIHDFLYSQQMSDRTYNVLMDRSLDQLRKGRSVIMDATFSRRDKRRELIEMLNQLEVPYYFIEMQTRDQQIKQRLKNREKVEEIISDARLENFEPLNRIYQPPTEISTNRLLHMDTEQSVEESSKILLNKLVRAHIEQI